LKALDPEIMPAQGSRADLGLLKAEQLLLQAGVENGQVILVADGVEGDNAARAAARLRQSGYRVSVLGVGTAAGAPLPDGQGGVIKDAAGKPRLVKLDGNALQSVAQAGGGRYSQLTGNETDIDYLLDTAAGSSNSRQSEDLQTLRWKEQGPLLAVLLLPLAALAFRRGWLLSVLICTALFTQPREAMAFGWDDLWLRTDQQAAKALQQQHYEEAARLAEDPLLRGSAEYKQGNYQKALESFSKAPGADAAYNRGNALASLGNYQQAIAAYDEALKAQPGMDDAAANKAAVEALLQQQQQQQQQQQDQQQDQQESTGQQGQQADSGDSSSAKDSGSEQQQSAEESTGDGNAEQSADAQAAANAQSAEDNEGEQQADNPDNAFANANRQLDEANSDRQDDNQSGPATPPPADHEAVKQAQTGDGEQPADAGDHTPAEAEALSSEEQLAAQQWLRRIADDPGGLLRRKFLYQYRQRGQQPESGNRQDW
ncbi:MAG: tetratricopeptide repeat protein, partial [Gammaproteobacteria bacterium]